MNVKCFLYIKLPQYLFSTALLLIVYSYTACSVVPYYSIRSQGANTARHNAGWLSYIYKPYQNTLYGTLAVIPSYTRSFNPNNITHCLFGSELNDCTSITIAGSRVANRDARAWLADYFYLPTDFSSTICFKPIIDNFIVDLDLYLDFDEWVHGLYWYVYAPIVHTRWNLNIKETITQKGVNAHTAGYFTPQALTRGQLLNSFTEFADGQSITPVNQTVNSVNVSTVLQPLLNAQMSSKKHMRTGCAEIRTAIGWNFYSTNHAHAGLNIQVAAPTGIRPQGQFLFEPIIGNGHHWELGGGLNGHYTWNCNDYDTRVSLLFEANITHLFKSRQKRTFDLINIPASRYMLAERLGNTDSGTPIANNLKGGGKTPSAQFKNEYAPLANISTITVNTRIALQADIMAMLNISYKQWSFDFGYNFWGRTCETISLFGPNDFDNNTTWALKGDAQVFGFMSAAGTTLPINSPIALSATQNRATLHAGTNFPVTGASSASIFNAGRTNTTIDNPLPATGDTNDVPLTIDPDSGASARINTSVNPLFISILDIDICGAQTKGLSNKLFTHISYTWYKRERWIPYFGIGGEVEFGHTHKKCHTTNECHSCAVSQWGIWFKGGIAFE